MIMGELLCEIMRPGENVELYEKTFGVIEPRRPMGNNGDLPNPFKA